MVLLDRRIQLLSRRDDIELLIHKDFSDLYLLAHEIKYNANSASGKEVIFLFGVNQDLEILGIKGTERDTLNKIQTFMGIFKPNIKFKVMSSFSPSNHKIIYYLHIYPSLKRLFFPHEIRQDILCILSQISFEDFKSTLQEIISDTNINKIIPINSLINFFSSIHIEQFSQYSNETVTSKINRLVDSIHYFESRDSLIDAIHAIGLDNIFGNEMHIFALKCATNIITHLDPEDGLSKQIVINRLQHLFKLLPEGIEEFEQNINYFLRDLIIEEENIFGYNLTTYDDLVNILQIFSSVGISVHLDRVIKEIEMGDKIQRKIKFLQSRKRQILDDDVLAKIFVILLPYLQESGTNVRSIFNEQGDQKRRKNKNKILEEIKHRNRIIRPINKHGRHERDTRLALLLKDYYDYECQSCESKRSKITSITVSHKVPLYFGVEFGGVDRVENMEVLCRFCHDAYETNFDKEIFENKKIVSKEDLLKYLMKKFPKNFETC